MVFVIVQAEYCPIAFFVKFGSLVLHKMVALPKELGQRLLHIKIELQIFNLFFLHFNIPLLAYKSVWVIFISDLACVS